MNHTELHSRSWFVRDKPAELAGQSILIFHSEYLQLNLLFHFFLIVKKETE
jgi:hypothetical protein